jgi:large subunit ribosomal protein L33
MAKSKTVKIRLVSAAGTGTFYTRTKNPKMPHKLRLRKYDPKTRKHEWFEEKKIK